VDGITGSKISAYFQREHPKGATVEKTVFTARMTIEGQVEAAKQTKVQEYMNAINKDKHCRCSNPTLKLNATGAFDFTLAVDIAHQAPSLYAGDTLKTPVLRPDVEKKKGPGPDIDIDAGGD